MQWNIGHVWHFSLMNDLHCRLLNIFCRLTHCFSISVEGNTLAVVHPSYVCCIQEQKEKRKVQSIHQSGALRVHSAFHNQMTVNGNWLTLSAVLRVSWGPQATFNAAHKDAGSCRMFQNTELQWQRFNSLQRHWHRWMFQLAGADLDREKCQYKIPLLHHSPLQGTVRLTVTRNCED